jgi:hypothetical protein
MARRKRDAVRRTGPSGDPEVRVTVGAVTDDQGRAVAVALSVGETSVGLDPDDADKLAGSLRQAARDVRKGKVL